MVGMASNRQPQPPQPLTVTAPLVHPTARGSLTGLTMPLLPVLGLMGLSHLLMLLSLQTVVLRTITQGVFHTTRTETKQSSQYERRLPSKG
jgi:hypothetical protein